MDWAKYLTDNRLKVSYPRVKILEYLDTNRTHPTADEIYNELVKEVNTLSKTTIYNTMNAFSKAGIVRALTLDNNQTRYDFTTHDHGHFKCRKCGKIIDFYLNSLDVPEISNFVIEEKNVYLMGVCDFCLEK